MFISYAQNSEDIVLWRALGHIEQGTYVDVGAADPTEYSVTKAFYDRGWSGVNVEPAPEFVARLIAERERDKTFAVCAGEIEGTVTLHHVPGTGLSTVSDEHLDVIASEHFEVVDITADVKRLDRILADAQLTDQPIHFLKIDVEGAEATVLRSIDLTIWRPWVVVVEATEPLSTEPTHDEWDALLTSTGYQFCLFDGLNRFYLADEHPELARSLSFPAGVFDQPYTVGTGQNELASRAEAVILQRDQLAEAYGRLEAANRQNLDGYAALEATYRDALQSYSELESRHLVAIDAYARLDAELAAANSSYERQSTVLAETLDAYHQLDATQLETVAAYGVLGTHHEAAIAHRDVAVADRRRLQQLLEDCHRALAAQAASFAHRTETLQAELDAMRRSRSWRITRPMRVLKSARPH